VHGSEEQDCEDGDGAEPQEGEPNAETGGQQQSVKKPKATQLVVAVDYFCEFVRIM
jgi:hypothetical protein